MLKLKEEHKQAEIAVRTVCLECLGKRMVQEAMWALYWETFGQEGTIRTQKEDLEWFRENGFERIPPEEIVCWECDGTGKIETWVKLGELFEEVGIDFEARLEGLEKAEMERTAEESMRFNVELYGGGE